MNPQCLIKLFNNGTWTCDIGHIVPYANDGSESFENLILLCCNCHRQIDKEPIKQKTIKLTKWKSDRNREIREKFDKTCTNFQELKSIVVPILKHNKRIFTNYGPDPDEMDDGERREYWLSLEPEIIGNNEKLVTVLEKNIRLLHWENKITIEEFVDHTKEFIQTRDNLPHKRLNLFPTKLLSIFEIEQDRTNSLAPSVSALQNFISQLDGDGMYIDLELVSEQILRYRKNGKEVRLNLNDRPRVQKIYWNHQFYKPNTTNLRLENLVFFLKWLDTNSIEWKFNSVNRLMDITLNGKHKVILCYEYCGSRANLYTMPISRGVNIVNLYSWNGGQFTKDAFNYSENIGSRLFNQNEFFQYVHRNLK